MLGGDKEAKWFDENNWNSRNYIIMDYWILFMMMGVLHQSAQRSSIFGFLFSINAPTPYLTPGVSYKG